MTEYRYTLTRELDAKYPYPSLCWVMLNPSTADDTVDDPTIRRVKSFTTAAGYGRLVVVNLFGLRATKPEKLLGHPDPGGPGNVEAILDAMRSSDGVVFAWGAWSPPAARGTIARKQRGLTSLARGFGHTPLCLGVTKAGAPRHPLYVPSSQPLVAFPA